MKHPSLLVFQNWAARRAILSVVKKVPEAKGNDRSVCGAGSVSTLISIICGLLARYASKSKVAAPSGKPVICLPRLKGNK